MVDFFFRLLLENKKRFFTVIHQLNLTISPVPPLGYSVQWSHYPWCPSLAKCHWTRPSFWVGCSYKLFSIKIYLVISWLIYCSQSALCYLGYAALFELDAVICQGARTFVIQHGFIIGDSRYLYQFVSEVLDFEYIGMSSSLIIFQQYVLILNLLI